MPSIAAAQYWTQRQKYRKALTEIESIADEETKTYLQQAITAYVRKQFRGISNALTSRMGCRLSCLVDGYEGPVEVEHAVPLNLIHNRILGVRRNGTSDLETEDIFPTVESLEMYLRAFMVGVLATPQQHRMLQAQTMHGEWMWLANLPPWDWDSLRLEGWNWDERPQWLRLIMNRYEHVPPPDGPIKYRPISGAERR